MTGAAAIAGLAERLIAGERAAAARALTLVENGDGGGEEILEAIFPHTGGALRIGVTGPPGTGKSTLVAGLARLYREAGERVGVIAVDPTSPYSGGALLGDRLRMVGLSGDDGLFIRSMASRGSTGGLAAATADAVDVLDAFGAACVIVETVGAGQTEVDVVSVADAVCLVLTPEAGDSVQAMKAGLMEIADIYVVNKADRPGADRLAQDIQAVRGEERNGGRPIVKTVATRQEGVAELREAIEAHRQSQQDGEGWDRRRLEATRVRIAGVVERRLKRDIWHGGRRDRLEAMAQEVLRKKRSPIEAARELLESG